MNDIDIDKLGMELQRNDRNLQKRVIVLTVLPILISLVGLGFINRKASSLRRDVVTYEDSLVRLKSSVKEAQSNLDKAQSTFRDFFDEVTASNKTIAGQALKTVAPPPGQRGPRVSLLINGKADAVSHVNGAPYTLAWKSEKATACQMSSPVLSGISLNGQTGQITEGDMWYPTNESAVVITVSCTDGITSGTASTTVTRN